MLEIKKIRKQGERKTVQTLTFSNALTVRVSRKNETSKKVRGQKTKNCFARKQKLLYLDVTKIG